VYLPFPLLSSLPSTSPYLPLELDPLIIARGLEGVQLDNSLPLAGLGAAYYPIFLVLIWHKFAPFSPPE